MKAHSTEIVPPREFSEADVSIIDGPTTTIAEVSYYGFVVTGEARRSPGDSDDLAVGRALAAGRALEALGQDLVRFAIQRSSTH